MGTDKELIKKRFEASFARYHRLGLVQQRICSELAGIARKFCGDRNVERALEVGAGTGFMTGHLVSMYPGARWYVNDIADAAETFVSKHIENIDSEYLWGDAEKIDFPSGLGMIASSSTVQWFDDLPAFAAKAAAATIPGGWLVLSSFGPRNFAEIRATTGEGLEYYPLRDFTAIFEEVGYRVMVAKEYTEPLHFETPSDVLHHIKATGVNSLNNTRWNRGQLADFEARYNERFSSTEGVVLTYHPLLLVAEKI